MKIPWPLFLAWKQLFPTQRKVSFFSLLAVVGVALGLNVMIVVVAFMKGFQHKFKEDIIDAQGHARAIPLSRSKDWSKLQKELLSRSEILAVSPYLQGPLLVQKQDYQSVPLSIGIDLSSGPSVLPLDEFLKNGQQRMDAHDAVDVTPVPLSQNLQDDSVFISQYVANRLGVRPGAILRTGQSKSLTDPNLGVRVYAMDYQVPSAEWKLKYLGEGEWILRSIGLNFEEKLRPEGSILDAGPGTPVFEVMSDGMQPEIGAESIYQTFRSSTIEVFSPSMIQRAQANEMIPPKEVRIGGIFEVPWQGFHAESMIGSFRLLEDVRSVNGLCDGMFIKFSPEISTDEEKLHALCEELELPRSVNWAFVPWFVENAWFFDLLKFEEYLMILIMVPIGLVAAFAIAIALMTSVLRKIREIGLLVAMGGARVSVGSIFCLQGFLIGLLGAILGCGLALLFIHYRDAIMSFIVVRIAGDEGKTGVAQFYDFYSLSVPYPWESSESASTFLTFALFSILVSTLAGLIPAWRASRMNPADALRNE
ncbi:FtsX-like permease family protein [Opitutales bacterium]|nr:FtsX-like permease family protein [Opitutales bacterium]